MSDFTVFLCTLMLCWFLGNASDNLCKTGDGIARALGRVADAIFAINTKKDRERTP